MPDKKMRAFNCGTRFFYRCAGRLTSLADDIRFVRSWICLYNEAVREV